MPSRSPRLAAATLALLVVVAGCAAPLSGDGSPVPVPDSVSAPAAETTPPDDSPTDRTRADGATPVPTAVPDARSPWGSDPIVVAVRDPADTNRDWEPLVREATAYWEEHAERYAGYPVDYEVRPTAENPDLVVEFVRTVPECDGSDDAAGCAPLVTDARQIDRPETVSVRTGFSDESTVLVLEHELGHTLGLTHDDAPADVMSSRSVLYTTEKPNATERDFPWSDGAFTVYVNTTNVDDAAAKRQQVRHALDYYERGAPGMPDNLTFTVVDDPAGADVVVEFAETSPCSPNAASCGATRGWDPDGDGAVETYSDVRIVLVDLETDAVGWHVGYWLAFSLGAERDEEKPAPFRDASYSDRRSEWWT
ncbi:matrixin [Halogeometricum limi]|uniref:Matrixin n=1 Tax=Halogeometricum limi TaxID=555875 RepID=A0A1I6IT60_9EURY|nr:matrixin [Halogeometricum limi]SFR69908.1 hypothetical protein SAMN04488124_3625 [Halogeometricum limi]